MNDEASVSALAGIIEKTRNPPAGVNIGLEDRRDGEKGCVWKIKLPDFLPISGDYGERIDVERKAAAARRDEMLTLQRQCGAAKDTAGARFFKDEATDALKEYRAACLLLPLWKCETPGDSQFKPVWEWPIELAPWIDRVVHKVFQ